MKPLVIANWKMNPATLSEAKELFNSVAERTKDIKNVQVVICPPFLYLSTILNTKYDIKIGGQNCFWEEKGAFTGEVSAKQLSNLGCRYVVLGHSERRKYFNETDEMINKKITAALNEKLKPILCIGETESERKEGKTFDVLNNQLQKNLKEVENLIIAYEPVWAVGTGNSCAPDKAKEVLIFLRKVLKTSPILYGGSVNSQNARDYIEVGFDGLLVGGASLNPLEFLKIIKSID